MTITSDLMYRLLVQSVSDYAIYMVDRDGIVLNWNAGAERAKGFTAAEIVGRSFAVFYPGVDCAADLPQRNLEDAARTGRVSLEGWRLRRDGTRFWASITIDAIYAADGSFLAFAKVTRDLTEQHALMERIEHQANHDGLTGLLNRSGLLKRLTAELASGRHMAIHCLDLDRFKPVNDQLGHAAGDAVLQTVASRLAELAGGEGLTGRIGGDEFVVAQFRSGAEAPLTDLGEGIVQSLSRPIAVGATTVSIGASVGVASAPEDSRDLGTLLRLADAALYEAKEAGRNRVVRVRTADHRPSGADGSGMVT